MIKVGDMVKVEAFDHFGEKRRERIGRVVYIFPANELPDPDKFEEYYGNEGYVSHAYRPARHPRIVVDYGSGYIIAPDNSESPYCKVKKIEEEEE